jgi:Protein of unknown function (DUF1403)
MDSEIIALPEGPNGAQRRRNKAREAASSVAVPNPLNLQPLPRWITPPKAVATAAGQGVLPPALEAAFAAGAAIFALDQVLRADPPWLGCLSMRQALKAGAVASRLLRLNADEASLRDACHLTRAGDDPGPAGRLHTLFRQLALRPIRLADETLLAVASEIEGAAASPEVLALLRADLALAERLGWERPLLLHLSVILDPVLRQGEAAKRPRVDSLDWPHQQHVVLALAAMVTYAQAVTLARKAYALTTAANTLRTRDGGRGLALILADDSVAPWRMVKESGAGKGGKGKEGLGSDRAAAASVKACMAWVRSGCSPIGRRFGSTAYEHGQTRIRRAGKAV